ncbi:MAG TPA: PKD domain-containing protein [Mycobacteriales bacterium]|jgi:PKD repeat protein|nr:PKD domain-containing protein [Mycobacteriales bacterium]
MPRFSRQSALLSVLVTAAAALAATVTPGSSAVAGTGTPTFATYVAPSNLPSWNYAPEPSIGVNPNTGAVMYQSDSQVYRVKFNDSTVPATASWQNVTPLNSIINIDPILATDSSTGRTWAGGLDGECSEMSYTDNDGQSWTPMVNPCAVVFDHESIGSGPWAGGKPVYATYNRAVYYCAQTSYDMCATSLDGGLTFLPATIVGGVCNSQHGHIKVAPNGTAYLPNRHCGGKAGGGITTNNGLTWSSYTVNGSSTNSRGFDPSVAITPDNTVYEAWAGANNHPMVGRLAPGATSWDRVTDLASTVSPALVASTFQSAVAGDNGRVAVAFLGTSAGGTGIPFDNGFHGVWYLYVSYSYDGGQSWTTVKASPDPVQRGCIWDLGGSNVCRNLLDFMDANVSPDGRVVVGYADGCVGACAGTGGTEAQSTSTVATITRQSTGKGLYAAYDSATGATPVAPSLTATRGNASVSLSWTTPSDGGSAITGYNVYRGTSSGGETLLTTTGVTNSYSDTTAVNGTAYYYRVAAVNVNGAGAQSNETWARPAASNTAPTACFTHGEAALSVSANGGCSTDVDGPISSWSWSWGDGSPSSTGSTAAHTYSTAGTYTVGLTVTDSNGTTGTTTQSVTVATTSDPDPSTQTLSNGSPASNTHGNAGTWQYYKVNVPGGQSQLKVDLTGSQSCNALGCNPNLDVYVQLGSKPTTASYACAGTSSASVETCTISAPATGWYYVGVYVQSAVFGSTYSVKATYS